MKDMVDLLNERIAELEAELAEHTAAEANDSEVWPMIERQGKRIAELEDELKFSEKQVQRARALKYYLNAMVLISEKDKRIAEMEGEVERLRNESAQHVDRIAALMDENERLRKQVTGMTLARLPITEDAERYRKCIKFNWLHPDYDPTGHAWEGE